MPIPMQIQRQFDALHRDAQKVLNSIDNLSQDIDKANGQPVKSSTPESLNIESLRSSLNLLRNKIDETSREVTKRARDLDAQVRSKPYPFIAGALGVGALTALLLERQVAHRR